MKASILLKQPDHINTLKGEIAQGERLVDNDMEAESPVDDHENLAKISWHPSNKAASVTELDENMRDVNDDLDQAEHKLDNDRAYRVGVDRYFLTDTDTDLFL